MPSIVNLRAVVDTSSLNQAIQQVNTFEQAMLRARLTGNATAAGYASSQADVARLRIEFEKLRAGFDANIRGFNQLAHSSAGARRELLVLGHEISQGNWKAFAGSLLVLGEQIDLLGKLSRVAALGGGLLGGALLGGVAAAAAFGAAVYSVHHDLTEFNKAIYLSGGASGLTQVAFEQMARSLATDVKTSVGTAREALLGFIATGKFSAEQSKEAAAIAVNEHRITGESIEKLTEKYTKLAESPSKFLIETRGAYGAINPLIQEHIRHLEEQGNKSAAVDLALKAVNDNMNGPMRQALQDQKSWWDSLTTSIGNAWNAFKQWGGSSAASRQMANSALIEQLQHEIKVLQQRNPEAEAISSLGTGLIAKFAIPRIAANIKAELAAKQQMLNDALKEQVEDVANPASALQRRTEASARSAEISANRKPYMIKGNKEQLKEELEKAQADHKDRIRDYYGDQAAIDRENKEYAVVVSNIKKRYEEHHAASTKFYRTEEAALDTHMQEIKNKYAKQRADIKLALEEGQLDTLTAARLDHDVRIKEINELEADINKKIAVSRKSGSKTSAHDVEGYRKDIAQLEGQKIEADKQFNRDRFKYADELARTNKKIVDDWDHYVAELSIRFGLEAEKRKFFRDQAKLTMTPNEARTATANEELFDRAADERKRIFENYEQKRREIENSSKGKDLFDFFGELDKNREQRDKALNDLDSFTKKYREFIAEQDKARQLQQGDWFGGLTTSLRSFQETAADVFTQTKQLGDTFTSSLTNGISRFVATGKFGFKDFARTVIQAIIDIYAKMVATKLVGMFIGALSGTKGFGSAGLDSAKSGYAFNAIVPPTVDLGPNLGGIQGTRATGGGVEEGKTYLVGEKGPEVLRMGSTPGYVYPNQSGGKSNINITFGDIIVQGGNTNAETAAALRKELLTTMHDVADNRIANALRPGGLIRTA